MSEKPPTARDAPTPGPLWIRVAIGLPMIVIGAAIAVFMAISVILEISTDDFFGMCIAALVSFSGCLLVREGWFRLTGTRPARPMAEVTSYHRSHYARAAGYPKGMPPDATRCAAVVYEEWQCPNPRGRGPEQAFCKMHAQPYDPDQQAA